VRLLEDAAGFLEAGQQGGVTLLAALLGQRLAAREIPGALGEAVGAQQLSPERTRELVGGREAGRKETGEEAWSDERKPSGCCRWGRLTSAERDDASA